MNPTDLNYRMPAEWDKHERTFISWPVRASMIYPQDYAQFCLGYEKIIRAIAGFEPVSVIGNYGDESKLTELFSGDEGIGLLYITHDDAWLRDNGPTFLLNDSGRIAGVNWRFNAWGEKYARWDADDQVAPRLLEVLGLKRFDAPLVLEGGSVHVDGEGTLLTTEQCLLHPKRNPERSKAEIEEELKRFFNVRKIVWLKNGLWGDETDGHVDNAACFIGPGRVLMQSCSDPGDENYGITQENIQILREEKDALGRRIEVLTIEQPPKFCDPETGKRYTLSYLNFYFVNGGIILPLFGGEAAENDRLALQTFRAVFPERRIRVVDGRAITREGGNVHCLTQQLPKGADGARTS